VFTLFANEKLPCIHFQINKHNRARFSGLGDQ